MDVTETRPDPRPRGPLGAQDIAAEMREQILRGPVREVATLPDLPPPATDLGALLSLHGQAFVECAYATLLKRRPEPEALAHHLGALTSGELSKAEILCALRYSGEGRLAGVRMRGLRRRRLLQRGYRVPGLGRPLRVLVGIVRLPRMARDLMTLEQALTAERQRQAAAVARLERGAQQQALAMADAARQARAAAEAQTGELRRVLEARIGELRSALEAAEARMAEREPEGWADPLVALAERVDDQARHVRNLAATAASLEPVAVVLRGLRGEFGWPEEDAAAFAARLAAHLRDVVGRAAQAQETAARNRADLLDQSRRLGLLLADVRRRLDQPFTPEDAARLEAEDDHRLDSLYVAFEDRFRGGREDIRNRQLVHLPVIRAAGAGVPGRPVVDVGAGRGEWLELLRAEGLEAVGVDLNTRMVELCRGLGLACEADDAVAYLRRQPDGSVGAVTGFHIIEHLPFRTFVALLDESLRVLAPGGVVLFETPNPANVLVGSRYFYLDPTHRNPMPAEMTAMIAEARGFVDVRIHELHPSAERFSGRDEVLTGQLDRLFHGPQDYALIAGRP